MRSHEYSEPSALPWVMRRAVRTVMWARGKVGTAIGKPKSVMDRSKHWLFRMRGLTCVEKHFLGNAEILINSVRQWNIVQDSKAEVSKLERDPAEAVGW